MALTDTSLGFEEARDALARWDVHVSRRQLAPGSGTANAAVIVDTPDGRLILRRRNPRYARADWAHFDQALFAHLRARGIPAPDPVLAPDGHGWVVRQEQLYELFHFIEGAQHRSGNPRELAAAGRLLARVHAACADFEPPVNKPWPRFHPPLLSRDGLHELLEHARDHDEPGERVRLLEQGLALATALVDRLPDDAYRALPSTVVHGDYHPGNLKFVRGRVVGLFDWDWASHQPRMVDLADGLLFFCAVRDAPVVAGDIWSLTSAFSIDAARAHVFGTAYLEEGGLDAADLRALPDLMRCRWLYCRVDAAQRKVEPQRRAEFVTRELAVPLACIDALEPSMLDGTLFAS